MGAEPKTTEKQGGTWGLWVRASLDLLRFFFLKFGFICIQFKKPCREIQGHISLAQCHNPDIDFFFFSQNPEHFIPSGTLGICLRVSLL